MLREFEEKRPAILGALLDAVAYGLGELPTTRLAALPRMADFAPWIAACEGALWKQGTFEEIYSRNRHSMQEDVAESDILVDFVVQYMQGKEWQSQNGKEKQEHYAGTASHLLDRLANLADLKTLALPAWPKNARALSARLRRIRRGLEARGIEVTFSDDDVDKRQSSREVQLWPTEAQKLATAQKPKGLLDSLPY